MQLIKRIVPILGTLLLLSALAAACAPASTPAPTAVPETPTALQIPTNPPATEAATAAATEAPTAAPTSAGTTGTSGELAGASLYEISCGSCHGQTLEGNKFEDDGQTIEVPALNWDELNTLYQTQPSRGTVAEQLAATITQGKDEEGEDLNPMMPHWSSLSQTQVDSLLQYIQAGGTAGGATPALSPEAMALQGEALYQAACAACHGDDGAGKTFEMDGNKISTPSLSWAELSQTYATDPSRGSVEDQLAQSITQGKDEEGGDLNPMMPRWSFLSQEQVTSLIQYIQATFK